MRSNTEQPSFSAGEISPLLYGRDDYQRVQSGLRGCRGFIPLRQGGVTRAPGTRYRGRTRGDAPARLIAFRFAADDSVILEFTAFRMRVWRYGALVQSGGGPYELVTPYDDAAVARLQHVQSADVIYLVDGLLPMQRLARLALADWTIGDAPVRRGPFKPENDAEGTKITASADTGGGVTLTATAAVFLAGHVGALFQLRTVDDPDIPTWEGDRGVVAGDRYRHDGRIYEIVSGDNTGVNPPVHASGEVKLGKNGPVWRYICDSIGIVRITAVASGTSATATVVKRLPPAVVAHGTWRWSEGAWSAVAGYPSAIALYDQRLVLAATPSEPRTVWFSALAAFRDFEPGTEADSSFAYTISGASSVNRILWLKDGARGLHIGALGEEMSSRSSVAQETIGPTNVTFRTDSTIGSYPAQPIAPDGRPIFISRDRARVYEMRFAFESEATEAKELSLPSEHLGADLFAEIAWQDAPLRLAWLRRASGDLCVLVYDPAEDVLGWAVYPLAGGVCESVCVSGSVTGLLEVVTLVVRRQVGSATRRFVEQVSMFHGVLTGAQEIGSANHLFASAVRGGPDNPAPFLEIDGLDHLEGETVSVWTEKGDFGLHVVSGGAVTLPEPVASARAGLFDDTCLVETLDVHAPLREGSSLGRQKRLKAVGLRWHRTCAAEVRAVEREFARPDVAGPWLDATGMPVPRDLVTAWSGVTNVVVPAGHAKEVTLQVRPVGGAPVTLLAATSIVEAQGG